MSVLKLIQERKSTRSQFDPNKPVSHEHLKKILEAARWAPTAHNMQNFEILIIDDKKARSALKQIRGPIIHFKGDVFRAHPARNIPEKDKPTPAMKRAQRQNIKKAQRARAKKK